MEKTLEVETRDEQGGASLPTGWRFVCLGDLVDFAQNGLSTRRSDKGTDTIVLRLSDITAGRISLANVRYIKLPASEIEKYELTVQDVICIRVNGSPNLVGRMVWFNGATAPVAFCDHFIRFRPRADTILPSYLSMYFDTDSVRLYIEHNMVSTAGQNTVSQGTLSSVAVPVPSLNEQQRIVAKIEELFTQLDAGVASLKRLQANLQRYKAAVLKAACEGKLVPQDRSDKPASQLLERILAVRRARWEEEQRAKGKDPAKLKYEEPAPPDTDGLPELPEGWVYSGLPQFVSNTRNAIKRGPFGSAIKKEYFLPSGYKVYEQKNVIRGDFSLGSYFIGEDRFAELSDFELRPGDVVISCSGTVGAIAIAPQGIPRGVINQALLKLTLDDQIVLRQYFLYLFRSKVQEILVENTRGSAMVNIASVQSLKEIAFPLPPIEEQRRIVAEIERRFSLLHELEATVEASLKRAERLRQAILRQAFEGKLVANDAGTSPTAAGILALPVQPRLPGL